MRSLFFVALLLALVFLLPAFGERPTANATKKVSKTDCGCAENSKDNLLQLWPIHCLQQLLINYPGPNDMYICLTFYENCQETGEEELWYGAPGNPIPQICSLCEPDEPFFRAIGSLKGHELTLDSSNAWNVVRTGLESAKISTASITPQYHKIPQDMVEALGIYRDVYVVAVPIAVSGKLNGTRYLCIETESFEPEELEVATFTQVTARTGAQFAIEYKVGSDYRKGFVWLKK